MSGPVAELHYFKPACGRVIEPYLSLFGFSRLAFERDGEESTIVVAYSRENVLLTFSYWPEHFPNYCVMVDIGFIEGDAVPERSRIGLWCAIPDDKRWSTVFRTEDELAIVLTRIRDDVLPSYARPLWDDPQQLTQLITRCYNEQEARGSSREAERKRQQAEMAFKAGNFGEVVSIYAALSSVDLTATDRKRLEIARRKIN